MNPAQPYLPRLEIHNEREIPRGWTYALVMHHPDASVTRHEVSLAWSDHDYWSGGRLAPSATVEHVLTCLTHSCPSLLLPAKFDLARARRWHPEIDRELSRRLGGAAA